MATGTFDNSAKQATRVYAARRRLTKTQGELNEFLWTTEVSYEYLLDGELAKGKPRRPEDWQQPAKDVLQRLPAHAWLESNSGRPHYTKTMEELVAATQANRVHVYRAVLISFVAAFEEFLTDCFGKLPGGKGWGPYVGTLAWLKDSPAPPPLATLLHGDVCRLLRHCAAHAPLERPEGMNDREANTFRHKLTVGVKGGHWPEAATDAECTAAADDAIKHVVGGAERSRKRAAAKKRQLPIEFFHTLFAFTHLHELARAIEQAHGRAKGEK